MNVRVKHIATKTSKIVSVEDLVKGADKSLYMNGDIQIDRETGVRDKNGKMVFERDIIRCEHYSADNRKTCVIEAEVIWSDTLSGFILFTKLLVQLSHCWNIEIIGVT